ncbi:MAG: M48 family metallopeptidase [Thermodesulfobacteriota bacterium]
MKQIIINNIRVDVIRKNIKNMHLVVYAPSGSVRISAPLRVRNDAIYLFAVSKLDWIKRHQRKFKNQQRILPSEYKDGESHYFQGRKYILRIKETEGSPRIDLKDKIYLDLFVKSGATLEYKKAVLNKWYRAGLKKALPEMIRHWEKKIGVKVNFFGVKQMKTKWGSCNISRKRIWINLELAKKSAEFLEYILVHEMVHLLERQHNKKFKSYMDHYLPNWKHLKDELNSC